MPDQTRYDALVVGGRCAGAATAMLLARGGARVLLIDRQTLGADTLSTPCARAPSGYATEPMGSSRCG